MPNSILHKRSSTSGVVPHAALLANGEIALNTADGTWFIKKTDGTVLDLRQPLIVDGGAQPLAGINADAQDWQTRVIAAGGTVSAATFTAVNNFCNAIAAANIRDRFYRLNLFCGDNLAAVLVPLYRGPSLAGTQYGNATDTNVNNNFVAGDYVETGTSAGLQGNGSNKWLDTGVNLLFSSATDTHIAAYELAVGAGNDRALIGADSLNSTPRSLYVLYQLNSTQTTYYDGTTSATPFVAYRQAGFWIGSNQAARRDLLLNGAVVATASSVKTGVGTSATQTYAVFALTQGATVVGFSASRLSGYSIGYGMTPAQALAYFNIMRAFQVSLNRIPPVVSNADAQDWVNRVYTAGSTVSATTATAVNNFCNAIDAAGLRDRFYRLNLFCGDNLTACLVPLYRGQSLGGTQYGNTTDTNIAFTSADYAETGATGGLLGNGSSKYLQTGLTTAALPTLATGHIAAYTINAFGSLAASFSAGFDGTSFYGLGSSSVFTSRFSWGSIQSLSPIVTDNLSNGFISFARTSTTTSKAYKNGTQIGVTDTATITPVANNGGGFAVFAAMAETGNVISLLSGRLGAYSIGSGMTDAQMLAYSNAIRTFQTALNRRPAVSNLDAQDWVNRVYAAGGTVSQSTADAVNTFCTTINSTGLRDRFYRLNLFCGDNLTACLVPLYRGQSLSGTQYGNTIDTNFNFSSSDYVETGSSGGLKGNGSSKYLNTGLTANALATGNRHLSVYESFRDTGAYRALLGAQDDGLGTFYFTLTNFNPGTFVFASFQAQTYSPGGQTTGGHWIATDPTSSDLVLYKNAFALSSSNSTARGTPNSQPVFIFAYSGSPNAAGGHTASRLNAYSIGLGLTQTQATVYYSALQIFQTALNRNV